MISTCRCALICGCILLARQLNAEILYFETFESANVPAVPAGWIASGFATTGNLVKNLATESTSGNPGNNLRLTADATSATQWVATANYVWTGVLPTADLSRLSLTADVQGSETGRNVWIYFYSRDAGGGTTGKLDWQGTTTASYSQVGGLLWTYFSVPPFLLDTAASSFTIGFRMTNDFGNDSGNYLWIDNIRLTYLPPGDFDSDGDVDGADFVTWQSHFPMSVNATVAMGDADNDGDVDGADFVVWQTNFPTASGPTTVVVPEPHSVALALAAIVVLGWKRIGLPFNNEKSIE